MEEGIKDEKGESGGQRKEGKRKERERKAVGARVRKRNKVKWQWTMEEGRRNRKECQFPVKVEATSSIRRRWPSRPHRGPCSHLNEQHKF